MGGASVMKGHGKENIEAAHPLVSRIDVGDGEGSAVSYMLRRVGVRVGNGDKELRFRWIWVGLKDVGCVPRLLPLRLQLLPVNRRRPSFPPLFYS